MEVTIDAGGRIVIPKQLRDTLGLQAGSTVDISRYGAGLHLVPGSRTARIVERDGWRVAEAADADDPTTISDQDVFGLLDDIRR